MLLNQLGIDLVRSFEGCSLVAYQDQGGRWTIGYGKTSGVKSGDTCTADEANKWLMSDLQEICKQVNSLLINDQLNSNQYSAIVCFTYNVGAGNLKQSTLLHCINTYHVDDAANEFEKWDHINGVENAGLLRRRKAERDLFCTKC